jgi:hypothetical protein
MMTRMERATATRALSLPRRLTNAPVAFSEEGVGFGGRGGGLTKRTLQMRVALAGLAGAGDGPDWMVRGHNRAHDARRRRRLHRGRNEQAARRRAATQPQIKKLKTRFGLSRVRLVGDRGMLTTARISAELRPGGLDWISALRAPQIRALLETGALQLSLFDEQDLVEITSPEFPGERLVCCHNPVLAQERARKRGELLSATDKELEKIAAATRREKRPVRGKDKIALRVGKVINHYKMAKHFTLEITEDSFSFTRNEHGIAAEAALDGIYVLRTSLPKDTLTESDVVARYKNLADVERFFRTLNSELDVRPIRHRLADRVRAHMFLRMLSYYLSWHMKQALAPIPFQDHDKPAAAAKRANPVADRALPM